MSHLPQGASFEELVSECFVAHRGGGLMLSPLDVELVASWARAGVPVEVVARGIRRAAQVAAHDARPGEPLLRSLRACRRQVEGEIRRYQAAHAGAHVEPAGPPEAPPSQGTADRATRRLRTALKALAERHPQVAPGVERLFARRVGAEAACLEDLESSAHALLLWALPAEERRALRLSALERAAEAPVTSVWARRHARRFFLSTAVCERWGFVA